MSIALSADEIQAIRRRPTIWEWKQAMRRQPRGELSALARHALLALAEFADPDGGNCYPSYERLAADMGRSRSQAAEGVKELVEKGWLIREAMSGRRVRKTLFVPRMPTSARSESSGIPDDGTESDTTAATVESADSPDVTSSGIPDATSPMTRPTKEKASGADALLAEQHVALSKMERRLVLTLIDGLRTTGWSDEAVRWLLEDARNGTNRSQAAVWIAALRSADGQRPAQVWLARSGRKASSAQPWWCWEDCDDRSDPWFTGDRVVS